ncbi:LA_0442/LA_0875 N-terminal domain-containing protein [Leptospira kmetyi]|uniref:4-hydroxy-3-methylbut-2-enyl diphosphate reductase n=1 Tax=Leptospira kmetyi TaxID=408139 RepID=A0A2M9XQA5_9LEPT|nr:4-hydroxy-3-methylbut-2-enyl diphosphate reductase [Leptospira kmetyi]AYV55661.1 4-hydroxy-3-methylbut-2-enyl diphosphate reductase [Leptospira kmetyi]PJZ30145.1 4-hydroxy-3-methylbut-2-enyl diphosphate reductase [Leptospira kmetyi]PJZ41472.1 4-hydroxy-3-methylbut-2-enyl diphosphate reductase [Leptospira kmetyi]TGK16536.1 4-hydroxy-3-methylbut-2-enyl diphosphate reductase [Leptospira kmetyi]TGK34061.1 4-hydroxy-3-methylbut-2-enyl diphosphate reductase [Leptospira kmetyi]
MSRISKVLTSSGAFLLAFAISLPLSASTIILKNGKTLQGKIVNQSRTEVQIEINGKVQTISKTEISEINLKDPKKDDKKVVTKQTETPKTEEPPTRSAWKETKWTITARSAILPGWGQWKVGQKKWAAISLVLFVGAALYANNSREKAATEENNYKTSSIAITVAAFGDPNLNPVTSDETVRATALVTRILTTATLTNPYFSAYDRATSQYNQAQWLLGAVYGLQLIHTFLFARDYEKMQALLSDPNPEGWKFSASIVRSPINGLTEITPTAAYTVKF